MKLGPPYGSELWNQLVEKHRGTQISFDGAELLQTMREVHERAYESGHDAGGRAGLVVGLGVGFLVGAALFGAL